MMKRLASQGALLVLGKASVEQAAMESALHAVGAHTTTERSVIGCQNQMIYPMPPSEQVDLQHSGFKDNTHYKTVSHDNETPTWHQKITKKDIENLNGKDPNSF
jgi:hypothetical protein